MIGDIFLYGSGVYSSLHTKYSSNIKKKLNEICVEFNNLFVKCVFNNKDSNKLNVTFYQGIKNVEEEELFEVQYSGYYKTSNVRAKATEVLLNTMDDILQGYLPT